MSLSQLLFGFDGRINRAKYWLTFFFWCFIAVVLYFVLKALLVATGLDDSMAMFFGVGLLIYLPFMVSAIAISVKRLHDRNKSAWWLAFYYLAPVALSLLVFMIAGTEPDDSDIAKGLQFVILVIHVCMLIDLGCLRGTSGPNRFGPDPLAADMTPATGGRAYP
jgi:uncharacterized membrane protein YhaH (DUF805 family)